VFCRLISIPARCRFAGWKTPRSVAIRRRPFPSNLTVMLKPGPSQAEFSLAEARHIVRDLFEPNMVIYWVDFLLSMTVGYACFGIVRRVIPPMLEAQGYPASLLAIQAGLFVIAGLALYRGALFIHELVHMRSGKYRAFRIAWNLLCGIPILMPSFLYYTHLDHHRRKHYGTAQDGEYLPLGNQRPWAILFYLSQSLIIPVLGVVRFLILAPLAWISPRFRKLIQQRASSMVMDPSYVRPLPTAEVLRVWRLQEVACFLLCLVAAIRLIRGDMPLGFLPQAYLMGVFIIFINSVRTLGAHRFTNDGTEMTFVEQLIDSVNYPRRPFLTGLWAPVGLRFHALHHLFPSMPYHNLAEAHRRLMAELPPDSPYRLTEGESLSGALSDLWQQARTNKAAA